MGADEPQSNVVRSSGQAINDPENTTGIVMLNVPTLGSGSVNVEPEMDMPEP